MKFYIATLVLGGSLPTVSAFGSYLDNLSPPPKPGDDSEEAPKFEQKKTPATPGTGFSSFVDGLAAPEGSKEKNSLKSTQGSGFGSFPVSNVDSKKEGKDDDDDSSPVDHVESSPFGSLSDNPSPFSKPDEKSEKKGSLQSPSASDSNDLKSPFEKMSSPPPTSSATPTLQEKTSPFATIQDKPLSSIPSKKKDYVGGTEATKSSFGVSPPKRNQDSQSPNDNSIATFASFTNNSPPQKATSKPSVTASKTSETASSKSEVTASNEKSQTASTNEKVQNDPYAAFAAFANDLSTKRSSTEPQSQKPSVPKEKPPVETPKGSTANPVRVIGADLYSFAGNVSKRDPISAAREKDIRVATPESAYERSRETVAGDEVGVDGEWTSVDSEKFASATTKSSKQSIDVDFMRTEKESASKQVTSMKDVDRGYAGQEIVSSGDDADEDIVEVEVEVHNQFGAGGKASYESRWNVVERDVVAKTKGSAASKWSGTSVTADGLALEKNVYRIGQGTPHHNPPPVGTGVPLSVDGLPYQNRHSQQIEAKKEEVPASPGASPQVPSSQFSSQQETEETEMEFLVAESEEEAVKMAVREAHRLAKEEVQARIKAEKEAIQKAEEEIRRRAREKEARIESERIAAAREYVRVEEENARQAAKEEERLEAERVAAQQTEEEHLRKEREEVAKAMKLIQEEKARLVAKIQIEKEAARLRAKEEALLEIEDTESLRQAEHEAVMAEERADSKRKEEAQAWAAQAIAEEEERLKKAEEDIAQSLAEREADLAEAEEIVRTKAEEVARLREQEKKARIEAEEEAQYEAEQEEILREEAAVALKLKEAEEEEAQVLVEQEEEDEISVTDGVDDLNEARAVDEIVETDEVSDEQYTFNQVNGGDPTSKKSAWDVVSRQSNGKAKGTAASSWTGQKVAADGYNLERGAKQPGRKSSLQAGAGVPLSVDGLTLNNRQSQRIGASRNSPVAQRLAGIPPGAGRNGRQGGPPNDRSHGPQGQSSRMDGPRAERRAIGIPVAADGLMLPGQARRIGAGPGVAQARRGGPPPNGLWQPMTYKDIDLPRSWEGQYTGALRPGPAAFGRGFMPDDGPEIDEGPPVPPEEFLPDDDPRMEEGFITDDMEDEGPWVRPPGDLGPDDMARMEDEEEEERRMVEASEGRQPPDGPGFDSYRGDPFAGRSIASLESRRAVSIDVDNFVLDKHLGRRGDMSEPFAGPREGMPTYRGIPSFVNDEGPGDSPNTSFGPGARVRAYPQGRRPPPPRPAVPVAVDHGIRQAPQRELHGRPRLGIPVAVDNFTLNKQQGRIGAPEPRDAGTPNRNGRGLLRRPADPGVPLSWMPPSQPRPGRGSIPSFGAPIAADNMSLDSYKMRVGRERQSYYVHEGSGRPSFNSMPTYRGEELGGTPSTFGEDSLGPDDGGDLYFASDM